ncbi:hypothetical protein BOTBODRAFT_191392 [Botryobasidium botryosum FD-172 SS1]|uniref:Uncharacterized protein n=1 Tax=Botryobasidium botryosum (strain FD-172 SS1) TaxID=930990 RepID=A0A067MAP4_BOTB1|nr:hypothetical protein BOTBODRAFT_191392 [Botryobasidium botryosum FD-172 SS1]
MLITVASLWTTGLPSTIPRRYTAPFARQKLQSLEVHFTCDFILSFKALPEATPALEFLYLNMGSLFVSEASCVLETLMTYMPHLPLVYLTLRCPGILRGVWEESAAERGPRLSMPALNLGSSPNLRAAYPKVGSQERRWCKEFEGAGAAEDTELALCFAQSIAP